MHGLVAVSWAVLVAADGQAYDRTRNEGEMVGVGSTYDVFNHPRDERTRDRVNGLCG
jgi:ABC-type phosphate transport system ATPase subunit